MKKGKERRVISAVSALAGRATSGRTMARSTLPASIFSALSAEPSVRTRRRRTGFFSRLRPWTRAAASLASSEPSGPTASFSVLGWLHM
ncbi:hypothetical protein QO058_17580 [Bosea vestrisii]|uniref:hypothetical protein n=1 Tax=Bosea vestrisii TaxID=151416 RepID=UPI0024DFA3C1|nr:hypothetical protein [Bosea vestrisii]WID94640.1 hypothetical protein QO058_17580 [Bosea vestrisii]